MKTSGLIGYSCSVSTTSSSLGRGPGLVESSQNRLGAVGMGLDPHGRLFVCGGIDGSLSVIDTADRSILQRYQLGGEQSFTNELIVTPEAVWVTDSFAPVLYKLPFGERGELPSEDNVVQLPLGGDLVYQQGKRLRSASTPMASPLPRTGRPS